MTLTRPPYWIDIRTRKGYGTLNLVDGAKGDSDQVELHQRNCDLRGTILGKIRELDIHRTYLLVEFVEETIHEPLVTMVKEFIRAWQGRDESRQAPLCRQWVALLRLQWVGEVILRHLRGLEMKANTTPMQDGYPWHRMIQQCEEWATGMRSVSFLSDFGDIDESICDADGKGVAAALRAARVEDFWYRLRHDLEAPLDGSVWCSIALRLIEKLSSEAEANTTLEKSPMRIVPEKLLVAAAGAASQIRAQIKSFPVDSEGILFDSGVQAGAHASVKQLPALCKGFFDGNSLNPKGLLAALLDMHSYVDTSLLLDDHQVDPWFSIPVATDARYVMTLYDGFKGGSKFTAIPKSVEDCQKTKAQISETWYLVWQVVFVVHAIAEQYLPREGNAWETYSLEKLCAVVGVDPKLAQAAIDQRITGKTLRIHKRKSIQAQVHSGPNKKAKSKLSNSEFTSVAPRPPAIEISNGPPDEILQIPGGWPPGWTRKVFERQSGASKGHRDRYWYSPKKSYKFRSIKNVLEFLADMVTTGGDEELAHKLYKTRSNK
jgi:Methyl-CpG binding domain